MAYIIKTPRAGGALYMRATPDNKFIKFDSVFTVFPTLQDAENARTDYFRVMANKRMGTASTIIMEI